MKKNLSFLSKVGVTAASIALVGGLAWANPFYGNPEKPGFYQKQDAEGNPATSDVWTIPTADLSTYAGKQIAFLGLKPQGATQETYKKYFLKNANPSTGEKNAWDASTSEVAHVFYVGTEGEYLTFRSAETVGSPYLRANGTYLSVENNQIEDEIKWSYSNGQVSSKTGSGSIYFDTADESFKLSKSADRLSAYVKTSAKLPYFDLANSHPTGNVNVSEDFSAHKTTLRYANYIASDYVNAMIVLNQENANGGTGKSSYGIEYQIGNSDWIKVLDTTTTLSIDAVLAKAGKLNENGDINDESHQCDVKITARTYVTDENGNKIDQTEEISKTYTISQLDDPKPVIENNYGTVAGENPFVLTSSYDAKARYKIAATGGTVQSAIQKIAGQTDLPGNVGSGDWAHSGDYFTFDVAEFVDYEQTSVTVNVANMVAKNDIFTTVPCTAEISLKAYYQKTDDIITVSSTPAPSDDAAKNLQYGSPVTIKGTTSKSNVSVSANESTNPVFVVKVGGVDKNIVKQVTSGDGGWTLSGQNYTFTLPEGIDANTSFSIKVPASAFSAKTNADKYPVVSAEETITFNQHYDSQNYGVKKTSTTDFNLADETTAYLEYVQGGTNAVTFKLYSGTKANTAAISRISGNAMPKLSKYNGGEVSEDNYTISNISSNQVTVTLTSTDADNYKEKLGDGTYLLTFPAGTLLDDQKKTNANPVTAYINVKEKVYFEFSIVGVNGSTPANGFCAQEDDAYLKVVTSTASGNDPDFTYIDDEGNVVEKTSGSIISLGKAGTLCTGADVDGEDYGHYVDANQFSSQYSKNTTATCADVTVYKHFEIAPFVKTGYYHDAINPAFAFNLESSEGSLPNGSTYAASDVDVEIGGQAAKLNVDADGNATLNLPVDADNKVTLANGEYTFSIPSTVYKNMWNVWKDPCGSKDIQVKVTLGDPQFSFDTDDQVTTATKKINITAEYALGTSTNDAIPYASGVAVDVKEDGAVVGNLVSSENGKGVITLNTEPTPGDHTYTIVANSYKTADGRGNTENTLRIHVKTNVKWSVVPTKTKVEAATENVIEFAIVSNPATVDNIPVVPTTLAKEYVTLKDALNTIPAEKVEYDAEKKTFKATFKNLVVANYTLNIASAGIVIDQNLDITVANDLFFTFQVYSPVTFDATTFNGTVIAKDAAQSVSLAVTAESNITLDRTPEIISSNEGWNVTHNGVTSLIESTALTISAGAITLNQTFAEGGDYTITAPEGAFKVDASNSTELTWTITVGGAANWIVDKTEKTMNYDEKVIALAYNELQTDPSLNYNQFGQSASIFTVDASKIKLGKYVAGTQTLEGFAVGNLSLSADNDSLYFGSPTNTLSQLVRQANLQTGDYLCVVFEAEALTASGQKNPQRIIKLNMSKNFVFCDLGRNVNTTAKSAITFSEYDQITYKRTLTANDNNNMASLVIPFDVPAKAFEGCTIYRINTIQQEEEEAVFHISTMSEDETVYAYMPYIIASSNTDLEIEMNAEELELEGGIKAYSDVPQNRGEVNCGTTKVSYAFKVAADGMAISAFTAANPKYMMGSGMLRKFLTVTNEVPKWRWYMESSNKTIEYARIVVDDDDATGINKINANDLENAEIFNLAGQRQNTLQRGINIINGKKVFINK